ncbi:hypothetical protein NHG33_06730 [Aerococcaceae bacterium NML130460]|nr:hypothetical protein [Aerococcaceae bacterium NML130460]
MSYKEYTVRMYAYNLKREDDDELLHYNAWLTQRAVVATDTKGKYIYSSFKEFYKKGDRKKKVNPELYAVAKRLKEYREKGGN